MQPHISIITVVKNNAGYLAQCMDSVFGQEYSPIEYIVIDGGSTDGSLDIIRERADRLAYWVSEPDAGIYDAMNKGLRRATGELIGILNSDDFYYNDSVLRRIASVASGTQADIFHGDQVTLYDHGNFVRFERRVPGQDIQGILEHLVVFHPTCFVRKAVYDRIGMFDMEYRVIADYDFLLRAYQQGCRFHYLDAPIVGFRHGGASASLGSVLENWRMIREHKLGSFRTWTLYSRDVMRAMLRGVYYRIRPPGQRLRSRHLEEAMRGWKRPDR